MSQFLYSIRDVKADCYSSPFVARSDGEAMRAVMQSLNAENQLTVFPDDFTLFRIGTWFEDAGLIESVSPQFVAHMSSLIPGGTLNPQRYFGAGEALMKAPKAMKTLSREELNGEADAVGDDAPVQSGAECDDPEERV